MPGPTRKEVIRQLDLLRAGLRRAMTPIRRTEAKEKLDAFTILHVLALVRADAKEVRDSIKPRNTPGNR